MKLFGRWGKLLFEDDSSTMRETVERAVREGVDLTGVDLCGVNLTGVDLSNAKMRKAKLFRTNFSQAVACFANFGNATVSHANFSGAFFSSANFTGAKCVRTCFRRSMLAHSFFDNAFLEYTDFKHAEFLGTVTMRGITGKIYNSHELLAEIAVRHDKSLVAVAAMIAGRKLGCWAEYTKVIKEIFGLDVMRKLRIAWTFEPTWGVTTLLKRHRWPFTGD